MCQSWKSVQESSVAYILFNISSEEDLRASPLSVLSSEFFPSNFFNILWGEAFPRSLTNRGKKGFIDETRRRSED